jgi:ribose transport system substrate-binding protein
MAALSAGLAAAFLVAACSSSGSSGSSPAGAGSSGSSTAGAGSSGSSTAGAGSATGGTGASAASCVASANANLSKDKEPLTEESVAPLNVSSLHGKKFMVVSITQEGGTDLGVTAGFVAGLAAAGATGTIWDSKGLASNAVQGIQEAIAQHYSGIYLQGIVPSSVTTAIASAKAAGIPVTVWGGQGTVPGIVGQISVDWSSIGTQQADYALSYTGCKARVLYVYTNTQPVLVTDYNAYVAEIKRLCPPGNCSTYLVNYNLSDYVTALPGQVETTLQRNSDANFLLTADDDLSIAYEGVKAVGSKIPAMGFDDATLPQAISGSIHEVADIGWGPFPMIGWYAANATMSAALGKPISYTFPGRVIDSTNWGTSASDSAQYPYLDGYQQKFEKAWGS